MTPSSVSSPRAEQERVQRNGGDPTRRRRLRPMRIALAISTLAVLAASVYVARDSSSGSSATSAEPTTTTTEVTTRDLVERESFEGTLGYASVRTVVNQLQGTVTSLAAEGSTLGRGDVLYRIDAQPITLMYGSEPAYRTLSSSTSDGEDVKQLEWNLVELGYDSGRNVTIDGEWTSATTAAVERWQEATGATEDGSVDLGEVVFLPGARRIGEHLVSIGESVQPGVAVLSAASTSQVVTMAMDASRQDLVAIGDEVMVELPGGDEVGARISEVGAVAESEVSEEGTTSEPTIAVTVTLTEETSVTLDQAPVDVNIEKERRDGVTTVPVTALLALAGGGYAVEVPDGAATKLVAVETGLFADGYVEVSGVEAGVKVVVPS